MPHFWELSGPLTVVLTPEGLNSPRIEFIQRRYGNLVALEGSRMKISKGGGCQQSVDSLMLSFSERPTDCMYLYYGDVDHIENEAGETMKLPVAELATGTK